MGILVILSTDSSFLTREKKMISCRKFTVILLVFMLTSCALQQTTESPRTEPNFDHTSHELFGTRPDIVEPQALHQLSPAQYHAFDSYFNSGKNKRVPPNRRVYDYLEKITEKFTYHGDTLLAHEALEQLHGNCMSLAMLTTALANRAGVNIAYQLMDDTPIFQQGENIIIKGIHVRTKLMQEDPGLPKNVFYLLKPGLIVDYFPDNKSRFVGNIKTSEYISRYYLNKAASALDQNEFNLAYWLALEAFKLNESNASAFNILAVVYKRIGAVAKAEEIYQRGIESLPTSLTLLKNYQILLTQQNRTTEAAAIERKLKNIDDPSPYRWRRLAELAFKSGDYQDAVRYYRRAIKIAPYMHDLHYALALVYSRLGKPKETEFQLELAMDNAHNEESRSLYQKKLDVYLAKLD
jgi:tetratricopeptide (TPR) repeat protein